MNSKDLALIVVPQSLWKWIFSHYHSGPTGGHMGEYKTLYRMRSRFWLPKICNDIKIWVQSFAHCTTYNVWRNCKRELYFYWTITTPICIMNIYLWFPGKILYSTRNKGHLINVMCYLTQFVVSTPTYNIAADNFAKLFMEEMFVNFGTCAVIVIDDGSTFKGTSQTMRKALKITYWCILRGNHKGNSVETFHHFLNKAQTITGGDWGKHAGFIQDAKTSQYDWNSSLIDYTDTSRILTAIGKEFHFTLDVDIYALPSMNTSNNSALFQYLPDVSTESKFAASVLQVIVEEIHKRHRELHNSKINATTSLKVGDIVKAHMKVLSKSESGTVKKA